ncbi:MAG: SDR family oxidoreductase, partial [Candidatus Acidiferrum sp.]
MRLIITGAGGQLGNYLARAARRLKDTVILWGSPRTAGQVESPMRALDLMDHKSVSSAFQEARPDVVLHAAAMARVADCHRDPALAYRVNAGGTEVLARLSAQCGARLVLVSTDLIFDGEKPPYVESDPPSPLSCYGRTKQDAELAALRCPRCAVARVSLLFGPGLAGKPTFFDEILAALRGGKPVELFQDEWRTPLDMSTAALALLALAKSEYTGVLHLGGPER